MKTVERPQHISHNRTLHHVNCWRHVFRFLCVRHRANCERTALECKITRRTAKSQNNSFAHTLTQNIAHRSRQKKASTQHQSMHLQLLNNAHRPISKTSTTKHAQQCNSKRASTRQSPDSSPSHKTSPFDRGKKSQHATT